MKVSIFKSGSFIAAFSLILLVSSFIIPKPAATTFIVVDDTHGMLDGRFAAPKKLPEKTKAATPTVTFTGRTVQESDSISVVLRQVSQTGTPGQIVVQGKKKIPFSPSGYQLPLDIMPLVLNTWYNVELTFRHKDGTKVFQKGQIMRVKGFVATPKPVNPQPVNPR